MSETNNIVQNTDVITEPPKSSGFNPSARDNDDFVQNKNLQSGGSTFLDESCNTCCGDACGLCCELLSGLLRIICCIRCWSDLTGTSNDADICCCCENAEGTSECCDCFGDGCCDACCECCN